MMHRLYNSLPQVSRLVTSRSICLSSTSFTKDLYGVLGVKPSATHSEIKGAYYQLSMKLHPDKNKDSETAADQFREVSDAYGVLGNIKLRKLYDRGVLHHMPQSASSPDFKAYERPKTSQRRGFDDPPDPELKERFYSAYARNKANRSSPSTSRSGNMYNFDAWTREHYSASFEDHKESAERKENRTKRHAHHTQAAKGIMETCLAVLVLSTIIQVFGIPSYDTPRGSFDDSHPNQKT